MLTLHKLDGGTWQFRYDIGGPGRMIIEHEYTQIGVEITLAERGGVLLFPWSSILYVSDVSL